MNFFCTASKYGMLLLIFLKSLIIHEQFSERQITSDLPQIS